MKTVQSLSSSGTRPRMFSLVTAVERYPEFLPWCDHAAQVLEHSEAGMTAGSGYCVQRYSPDFRHRNVHELGERVQMHLVKGPFPSWRATGAFIPWATAPSGRAKVELQLNYGFSSARWPPWWGRCLTALQPPWWMRSSSAPRTGVWLSRGWKVLARRGGAKQITLASDAIVVVCLAPRQPSIGRRLGLGLPVGAPSGSLAPSFVRWNGAV